MTAFSFRKTCTQLALGAIMAAGLAGWGGGAPQPRSQAQADYDACRVMVDQAYDKQNRGEFIRESNTDTPFGGPTVAAGNTVPLSQRYGYNQDLSSCVHGSAANITGMGGVGPLPVPAAPHAP